MMYKTDSPEDVLWSVAEDGWIVGDTGAVEQTKLLPLLLRERLRGALIDRDVAVSLAPTEDRPGNQDYPPQNQGDPDLEACSEALADGLITLLFTPDNAVSKVASWVETLTVAWQFGILWQSRDREIGGLVDFYATLHREAEEVLSVAPLPHDRVQAVKALYNAGNTLLQASLRAYHRAATLELERAASRDWLTTVYNRAYLQRRLHSELARAKRFAHPVSVVMLDVDGFKTYNDTFGHLAGDEVLQRISRVFLQTARSIDIVTRYGGDEFVIIMPETSAVGAETLTKRITDRLLTAQSVADWPYPTMTVSYGIATYPDDAANESTLLHAADQRLYAMKQAR